MKDKISINPTLASSCIPPKEKSETSLCPQGSKLVLNVSFYKKKKLNV